MIRTLVFLTNGAGVDTGNISVVQELIGQGGVLAVLVWFLYYTTKVTIPSIHRQHNELVEKIIGDHRATIADITERFDRNLREEREARRKEIAEERQLRKSELSEIANAMRSISHEQN